MKVAPVYAALAAEPGISQSLVHTGQHYDESLNDVFFRELPLPSPDVRLEVGSGSHAEQTARALVGLERTFIDLEPALVLVPGDVNSTLAGALAAVKLGLPVAHLEAGLRSRDPTMPEEHNRVVTDRLASLLLTHSEDANENLAREGVAPEQIAFVGNTMIDTLLGTVDASRARAAWREYDLAERTYLLVTLHRPSLVDDDRLLEETLRQLTALAESLPVVFPVHPRTRARIDRRGLRTPERLILTAPLSYETFLSLELGARAVLTDSGGVQEETTALGVPCFTLRANTERPVTISAGTNTLLGLDPRRIRDIPALIDSGRGPNGKPPLWDGRAGARAAAAILAFLDGGG